MPCVGHPWRKHFCDVRFIVMEVHTSVMIILVMSSNTSTTAHVWLSWFCHKFVMNVHAWQKTRPTVTNTYHHGSVFFCSVVFSLSMYRCYKSSCWDTTWWSGVISSTFTYNGCKPVLHMRNTWVKLDEPSICRYMASEHWDRKVERESYSRYDQHRDVHHWWLAHLMWWSDMG